MGGGGVERDSLESVYEDTEISDRHKNAYIVFKADLLNTLFHANDKVKINATEPLRAARTFQLVLFENTSWAQVKEVNL